MSLWEISPRSFPNTRDGLKNCIYLDGIPRYYTNDNYLCTSCEHTTFNVCSMLYNLKEPQKYCSEYSFSGIYQQTDSDFIEHRSIDINTDSSFKELEDVFKEALDQVKNGKGKQRHNAGGNLKFIEQPIMQIARTHGLAYLTGQSAKKLGESHILLDIKGYDAAIAEILGAINYAAAAVIRLKELKSVDGNKKE